MCKLYYYKGMCKRVIDGDTIVVDIDLGFNLVKANERVRLANINAPEIRTKDKIEKTAGLESKEFLADLIEGRMINLKTIQFDDKYGRYLALIYINDIEVNEYLVKKGYAKEY